MISLVAASLRDQPELGNCLPPPRPPSSSRLAPGQVAPHFSNGPFDRLIIPQQQRAKPIREPKFLGPRAHTPSDTFHGTRTAPAPAPSEPVNLIICHCQRHQPPSAIWPCDAFPLVEPPPQSFRRRPYHSTYHVAPAGPPNSLSLMREEETPLGAGWWANKPPRVRLRREQPCLLPTRPLLLRREPAAQAWA